METHDLLEEKSSSIPMVEQEGMVVVHFLVKIHQKSIGLQPIWQDI
jgi:hypothetical protein